MVSVPAVMVMVPSTVWLPAPQVLLPVTVPAGWLVVPVEPGGSLLLLLLSLVSQA